MLNKTRNPQGTIWNLEKNLHVYFHNGSSLLYTSNAEMQITLCIENLVNDYKSEQCWQLLLQLLGKQKSAYQFEHIQSVWGYQEPCRRKCSLHISKDISQERSQHVVTVTVHKTLFYTALICLFWILMAATEFKLHYYKSTPSLCECCQRRTRSL